MDGSSPCGCGWGRCRVNHSNSSVSMSSQIIAGKDFLSNYFVCFFFTVKYFFLNKTYTQTQNIFTYNTDMHYYWGSIL